MTWKEFKDRVESKGVTDDDAIEFIDIGLGPAEFIDVDEGDAGWKVSMI